MSPQRWFENYRSTGLIDWPAEIRDDVRRELSVARTRCLPWVAVTVVAAVVGLAAALAIAFNTNIQLIFATVPLGLWALVGGIAGFRGEEYRERWKAAKDALREHQLETFEQQTTAPEHGETRPFVLIAPSKEILVLDSKQKTLILQPCVGLINENCHDALNEPT